MTVLRVPSATGIEKPVGAWGARKCSPLASLDSTLQGKCQAARYDRTRPHGCQYGAPAAQEWPSLRCVRPVAAGCSGSRKRRTVSVLDEIVQSRRDTKAAKRLLIRLLKKAGMPPKRIITDKLRPYGAAKRDVMPAVEHRSHKGLNNRAENSHLPLRKRERTMQGFRSTGSLQRFISIFSALRYLFVTPRHTDPRWPHTLTALSSNHGASRASRPSFSSASAHPKKTTIPSAPSEK